MTSSSSGSYNALVDDSQWHAQCYPQLVGQVYMDHAGAAVYSRRLVEAQSQRLMATLAANPHR